MSRKSTSKNYTGKSRSTVKKVASKRSRTVSNTSLRSSAERVFVVNPAKSRQSIQRKHKRKLEITTSTLPATAKALQAIDALSDREITQATANDPDAAPIADRAFWKHATLVERTPKQAISIRMDKDVIDWFKAQGKGYQGRMNAVLRTYMISQIDDC